MSQLGRQIRLSISDQQPEDKISCDRIKDRIEDDNRHQQSLAAHIRETSKKSVFVMKEKPGYKESRQ
jgi:hypothetical protein